jgi:XTP/dITP diphosphohydrolase
LYLAQYGITVEHAAMKLDEIQAVSVERVAAHKAAQAYAALGRPVMTEDGGFFIPELGGLPGALAEPVDTALGVEEFIPTGQTH